VLELPNSKRPIEMPVIRNQKVVVLRLAKLVIFCGGALLTLNGCVTSGAVTDSGCEIWREYTPHHGSGDTEKTVRALIILNEAMEAACSFMS
jgi:hypothetical protein